MAAARWQKCVYVHKSRIFADIPHPLCVSVCVLCAPDLMNISFELEREIVVQWKGLSYLNIFTARHHHSIPPHLSLSLGSWSIVGFERLVCVCVSCFGLDVKKELCTHRNNGLKERVQSEHSHFTHTFGRYQLFGGWHFTELKIYAVIFVRERKICKRSPATGWLPSMNQIILCTHKLCQWFSLWSLSFFSICNEERATRSLSLSFVHLSNFGVSFCSPAAWMHTENCISPEFIDFLIKLCHFSP